jgi:peptide/nickel transport system permease protein
VIYATQTYIEKLREKDNSSRNKRNALQWIKFYLIPGWRDPEFNAKEYEIGKIKSKRRTFRRLLTPLTIIGFILICFIIFLGVFAPWLTLYPLQDITFPYLAGLEFQLPSQIHPLGTTKNGYDILARLIWGARTTLTLSITTILIAAAGGTVVGIISAYFGGRIDSIIMRLCDVILVFPSLIIVLLLVDVLGATLQNILYIFGIFGIPGYARFMRSTVLQIKQNAYIESGIAGGAQRFKIMFKHILPNAISPLIVSFFGAIGAAILGFAGLAFIGLGDQSFADWGTDINYATENISGLWVSVWPGVFIGITVLGFMLIGDGLRDALDPRLKLKK